MVHLPDEILLHITRFLPDLCDFTHKEDLNNFRDATKTLLNICLVSKAFCAFTQPLLYRTFIKSSDSFDWSDGHRNDSYYERNQDISKPTPLPTRLQQFLRSLIERPDLAAQTVYLRFETIQQSLGHKSPPYPAFKQLFLEASHNLPLVHREESINADAELDTNSWREDWRIFLAQGGKEGGDCAEITLLLTLVPNLKYLDICTSRKSYGTYLDELCQDVIGMGYWQPRMETEQLCVIDGYGYSSKITPSLFSHLDTLVLRSPPGSVFEVCFPMGIICIPSLRSLTICGSLQNFDQEHRLKMPLTNIRELRFEDCTLDDFTLQAFIVSCDNLESLYIEYGHCSSDFDINLDENMMFLSRRCNTLKHLHLIVPDEYYGFFYTASPFDLSRFTHLATLETNPDFLSDGTFDTNTSLKDTLPTSLECLYLRFANKDHRTQIEALANEHEYFSNFKSIDIGIERTLSLEAIDEEEIAWITALEECVKKLRKTGIECNIPIEGTQFNLAFDQD